MSKPHNFIITKDFFFRQLRTFLFLLFCKDTRQVSNKFVQHYCHTGGVGVGGGGSPCFYSSANPPKSARYCYSMGQTSVVTMTSIAFRILYNDSLSLWHFEIMVFLGLNLKPCAHGRVYFYCCHKGSLKNENNRWLCCHRKLFLEDALLLNRD